MGRGLLVRFLARQPVELLLERFDEFVDQRRLQEIVFQAFQDGFPQRIASYRQPIVTGSPVANVGAAVVALADQGVPAAADPAGQQAGKQVTRAARPFGSDGEREADGFSRRRLPLLHFPPEVVADDSQAMERSL